MAAYDWTKGSRLFMGGTMVKVGPSQRWNSGRVLGGEVEEIMR